MKLLELLIAGLAFTVSPIAAQWLDYPTPNVPRMPDGKPNLSAPTPRTADGKPDLSGLWEPELKGRIGEGSIAIAAGDDPVTPEFLNIGSRLEGGLPYQPWAAQLARKRSQEEHGANDPLGNGFPVSIVRLHSYATPRKIIQNPGLLVILYELNSTFRQIFTDGRPLSGDPNPTWNGYSSGKWEGDVLVVKTNGFRDGIWLDSGGSPLSEGAVMTEKFHRVDFGRLEIELTVEDLKTYTKPWKVKMVQTIKLDTDLLDKIMMENEKDIKHLVK